MDRRQLLTAAAGALAVVTPAAAHWKKVRRHRFEAFFRFFLQDADSGAPIGTDNIRLRLTLDDDGDTLTGTFVSQIKDLSAVVLLEVSGDYSATRITV